MIRKYLCCLVLSVSVAFANSSWTLQTDRLDRIDTLMNQWIDDGKFPGGAVLISQGNEILKFGTYGTIDGADASVQEDTLYRLFSMSKPITVAAALILYERGDFLLDDPIDQLWPAMAELRVYESGEGDQMVTRAPKAFPTVRDLMMHTSGFYYAYSDHPAHQDLAKRELPKTDAPISEVAATIAQSPLLFEPGTKWNYGYSQDILAGLVEYLAGEPYGQFLERELLGPLGMEDTGYAVPESEQSRVMNLFKLGTDGQYMPIEEDRVWASKNPVAWGGTGLITSARDYWTFSRMLIQGGIWEEQRILSAKTVEYMLQNQLPPELIPFEEPGSPYARFAKGYGFGLGVKVMLHPEQAGNLSAIGDAGWSGAASTHFWMIPEHDMVILFLTPNRSFLAIQPLAEKVKVAAYQSLLP